MSVQIKVKKLREDAVVPKYQTAGAAGMDLAACIDEPIIIEPGKRAIVPTGIALEIPNGYEVQIRARSGLAANHGVGLPNGIGTIDSDYRGELKVILINWGEEKFVIESGMRVAQMVVARYEAVQLELTEELGATDRGEKRFGSTGIRV